MPTVEEQKQIKKELKEMKSLLNVGHSAQKYANELDASRIEEEARVADDECLDERGEKSTYWAEVKKKIHSFTQTSGQNSFVEWQTGIMDIMGAMCLLSKALYHSPSITLSTENSVILSGLKKAKDDLALALNTTVAGELKNIFKNRGEGISGTFGFNYHNQAQDMSYGLDVDDKGNLTTKLYLNNQLVTTDKPTGQPLVDAKLMEINQKVKQIFDSGVAIWLKDRGLNVTTDPKGNMTVTEKDAQGQDVPVTVARLKELDKDDDEGLKAFFVGNYKLDIEKTATSSMTP
ncbi:hypothetical protein ACNVED_08995 [Legionella sp. D16C41]|uniref:hypothetical protein n=1 Tax=Legionella sp. D16C41 TaxID=3402688 RepID=UPI003AF8E91C